MAIYTAADFLKGDVIYTQNGVSFAVLSNGVAGQSKLTVRERKGNGKLSSATYRVEIKAVSLRSPRTSNFDGAAPVESLEYQPRHEMTEVRRARTVEVAPIGFRLASVLASVPMQARMF